MLRYADHPGCLSRALRHACRVPRARLALLVALAGISWLAPAAVAQEEGVFVDPGSPTGKEYAIPFESARREADPSGGSAGAPPGTAPLFGAGIVASGASAGGTDEQPAGTGRQAAGTDGATAESNPGDSQEPVRAGDGSDSATEAPASDEAEAALEAAIQTPGAPSGGLDAPAVIALLAGGLLLAGGVIGLIIRRTRP